MKTNIDLARARLAELKAELKAVKRAGADRVVVARWAEAVAIATSELDAAEQQARQITKPNQRK